MTYLIIYLIGVYAAGVVLHTIFACNAACRQQSLSSFMYDLEYNGNTISARFINFLMIGIMFLSWGFVLYQLWDRSRYRSSYWSPCRWIWWPGDWFPYEDERDVPTISPAVLRDWTLFTAFATLLGLWSSVVMATSLLFIGIKEEVMSMRTKLIVTVIIFIIGIMLGFRLYGQAVYIVRQQTGVDQWQSTVWTEIKRDNGNSRRPASVTLRSGNTFAYYIAPWCGNPSTFMMWTTAAHSGQWPKGDKFPINRRPKEAPTIELLGI